LLRGMPESKQEMPRWSGVDRRGRTPTSTPLPQCDRVRLVVIRGANLFMRERHIEPIAWSMPDCKSVISKNPTPG
jgi:hypothetical protein